MSGHVKGAITSIIIAMAIVSTSCATTGKDLVRDGVVDIEKESSRYAMITLVSAMQEGADLLVRGELRRRHGGRSPIPGHIDVQIIGTTGEMLADASVGYHRRSAKWRSASFYTRLETVPPPGSTIRVLHDAAGIH